MHSVRHQAGGCGLLLLLLACFVCPVHAQGCVNYASDPLAELGSAALPTHGWPTPRAATGAELLGDHLILSAATDGYGFFGSLEVFDVADPTSPQAVGFLPMPGPDATHDVALYGTIAYVANAFDGIQIVDLGTPTSPQVVGNVPQRLTSEVAVDGDRLYSIHTPAGTPRLLQIFDLTVPTSPAFLGEVEIPGGVPSDLAVRGSHAYVTKKLTLLRLDVVDVSNPSSPAVVGLAALSGSPGSVLLDGPHAYVGTDGALRVVDVSSPAAPVELPGSASAPSRVFDLFQSDDVVYAAGDGSGPRVFDISTPWAPAVLGAPDSVLFRYSTVAANDEAVFVTGFGMLRAWPVQCQAVGAEVAPAPAGGALELAIAPNPAAAATTVFFSLPGRGRAALGLYDTSGRLVRRLAAGEFGAGRHESLWDGRDERGRTVAPGVYFASLRFGEDVRSRKVVRVTR